MVTLRPMVRGRRELAITRIPLREGFRVGGDGTTGVAGGAVPVDHHRRPSRLRWPDPRHADAQPDLRPAGANADVLMVGATNDLDWRREMLRERGLMTDDLHLLNIYEHYRDTDWPGEEPGDAEPADLSAHLVRETTLADGSPWRRAYKFSNGRIIYDYLRPDGSTFIRMPHFVYRTPATWPNNISSWALTAGSWGISVASAAWYRRWLRELTAEQELRVPGLTFQRPAGRADEAAAHPPHLRHAQHTRAAASVCGAPKHGESTNECWAREDGLDALVTLTKRQPDDIAPGAAASNMFVIPNPVRPAARHPECPTRDPRAGRVRGPARAPEAAHGRDQGASRRGPRTAERPAGHLRQGTATDAARRTRSTVSGWAAVTMKGHDPRARDALWQSSAFLMTSRFEGYPLSTLESISHGCPVVSYDIKYGPREQITEGEDGFLVESGNIRAMRTGLSSCSRILLWSAG